MGLFLDFIGAQHGVLDYHAFDVVDGVVQPDLWYNSFTLTCVSNGSKVGFQLWDLLFNRGVVIQWSERHKVFTLSAMRGRDIVKVSCAIAAFS